MRTLADLYNQHEGKVSDKWEHYLRVYHRLLTPYRDLSISVLEIGIQNGGSLEIWSQFFAKAKKIVGCDISQACGDLIFGDPRISIVIGDACAEETKCEIIKQSTSFDLIIDDGSHKSADIVKTFLMYFPLLREGGLFVVEDLHCSYWQEFEGGLFHPYSSMSFFKIVADLVNQEHWGISKAPTSLISGFEKIFDIAAHNEIFSEVHSIEFLNSVCVVRKESKANNELGKRVVVGKRDDVLHGLVTRSGKRNEVTDQSLNIWTAMEISPAEQYKSLNQAVTERDGQIDRLNQALTERDVHIQNLTNMIDEIRNSTSWHVSAPVRWVGWWIGHIKTLSMFPFVVLKRSGGIKNALKKAGELYRREGVSGISRGLAWVAHAGGNPAVPGSDGHNRSDYAEWIRRHDTLTHEGRSKMRQLQSEFAVQPLISVVMPTYNPKPEWLVEAIESVRNQIYPHWELCIADDASTNPAVHKILREYKAKDTRINVVFRERNGHISAASNSALEIASGEWMALIDHDDVLAEHALFWVAETINRHPEAGLIYSDEDKIADSGERLYPYFKCDWNPDLFYSHNMITHLGVYRSSLIKRIGGFREGFEGAQDYDLALRCIENISPKEIIHIPRILYHWRMHTGSTAQDSESKPYAMTAGERAINEHFERTGVKGKVAHVGHCYQPLYQLPETHPLVSIIIPTRNGRRILEKCVYSVLTKTTYKNFEILIVNNGSDEPDTLKYLQKLTEHQNIKIINDNSQFNYSYLNNKAVSLSNGQLVCLLNNDIEVVSPNWLSTMASHALREDIGAVGAKLLYSNMTIQHGGVILGVGGFAGHAHKHFPSKATGFAGRLTLTQNYSAVTAACLVVRKNIFDRVGGLDEQNLPIALNDIDFCLKIRELGYRNIWTPDAVLFHHESLTRGYEDTPEKKARFEREANYFKNKWGDLLNQDPAYSPNLTLDFEDFSYAWPPRVELL